MVRKLDYRWHLSFRLYVQMCCIHLLIVRLGKELGAPFTGYTITLIKDHSPIWPENIVLIWRNFGTEAFDLIHYVVDKWKAILIYRWNDPTFDMLPIRDIVSHGASIKILLVVALISKRSISCEILVN